MLDADDRRVWLAVAVQTDIEEPIDAEVGSVLVAVVQTLGGVIGLTIATSIFTNQLTKSLLELVPGASRKMITSSSVTVSWIHVRSIVS